MINTNKIKISLIYSQSESYMEIDFIVTFAKDVKSKSNQARTIIRTEHTA